eukprot:GHRR01026479.1.p1 GENE.GHRR01026479.1~~GHRR01026479.1.p1  ORF type:complete len:298 (+),score=85.49 GHRR01026479.1:625-1518(+)
MVTARQVTDSSIAVHCRLVQNPTPDVLDSKLKLLRVHKQQTFIWGELAHLWSMLLRDAANEEAILERAFQFFDKDGNGELSVAELKTTMSELGDLLTEKEIETFISLMDVNNDGVIGYQEFLETLRSEVPEFARMQTMKDRRNNMHASLAADMSSASGLTDDSYDGSALGGTIQHHGSAGTFGSASTFGTFTSGSVGVFGSTGAFGSADSFKGGSDDSAAEAPMQHLGSVGAYTGDGRRSAASLLKDEDAHESAATPEQATACPATRPADQLLAPQSLEGGKQRKAGSTAIQPSPKQ